MHYKIRVSKAIFGDLVTVTSVCEAMATAHAKGYGQLPYHHPTYAVAIKRKTEQMAQQIREGYLLAYDLQGFPLPNPEACQAHDVINATVTVPSLTAWGAERGDTFQMEDTDTVKIVTSGLNGRGVVVLDGRDSESMVKNTGLAARSADKTPVVQAPANEARPVATPPQFTMKKAALIEQHQLEWTTVTRDISDAKRNGLSDAAKAGRRGWREADALEWARTQGKLVTTEKPANSLTNAMHKMTSLPARRHHLEG